MDEVWESMPTLPPVSSFGQATSLEAMSRMPYTLVRPIGPHSTIEELGAATDAVHNPTPAVPSTPADAEASQFAALLTPTAGVATPPASAAPKKRGPGRPPKPRPTDPSEPPTAASTPVSDFDRAGTPVRRSLVARLTPQLDSKPFSSATASAAFALAAATAPVPHMTASMPAPAASRVAAPSPAPSPPKAALEPALPTPIELAAETDQFHALPADAASAFRTDPKTGELIWFPAPPAVAPRSAVPTHSLAYIEHRARQAAVSARPAKRRATEIEVLHSAALTLDHM